MFIAKEVTRLTRTEDMLDAIYEVADKDARDFMDKMNCNVFVRREGNYVRLTAEPQGIKELESYAPLCGINGFEITSKLH